MPIPCISCMHNQVSLAQFALSDYDNEKTTTTTELHGLNNMNNKRAIRSLMHLGAFRGDDNIPQLAANGLLLRHELPEDHAKAVDVYLMQPGNGDRVGTYLCSAWVKVKVRFRVSGQNQGGIRGQGQRAKSGPESPNLERVKG